MNLEASGVLRIDAAGLTSLDDLVPKLALFPNTRRLYLRKNNLRNIPSLAFLSKLELLDLSGNPEIDDVNVFIENLKDNENLYYLTCKFQSEDDEDNVIVDLPTLKIVNGMVAGEGDERMPEAPELGNDLLNMKEPFGTQQGSQNNKSVGNNNLKNTNTKSPQLMTDRSRSSTRSISPGTKFQQGISQNNSNNNNNFNKVENDSYGSNSYNSEKSKFSTYPSRGTATPPPPPSSAQPQSLSIFLEDKTNFKQIDDSEQERREEQLKKHTPVFNEENVSSNTNIEQLGKEQSIMCNKFFKQYDAVSSQSGKPKSSLTWREDFSSVIASTKSALFSTLTKTTFTEQAAKCKCTLSDALIWVSSLELMNKQLSKNIPALSIYLADSLKALLQTIMKALSELRDSEDGYEKEVKLLQDRCKQGEQETNDLLKAAEMLERKIVDAANEKANMEEEYENKLENMRMKLAEVARERDEVIEINRRYEELLSLSNAKQFANNMNNQQLGSKTGKGNAIGMSQMSQSQLNDYDRRGGRQNNKQASGIGASSLNSSQLKKQGRLGTSTGPIGTSQLTTNIGNNNNNNNNMMNPNATNMETFMANYKGPRILSVKMLNDFITQIVESKMNYEAKRERIYNSLKKNDPKSLILPTTTPLETNTSTTTVPLPETMEQHLYTFLCHKYGLKYLVLEWADSILASIAKHSVEKKRIFFADNLDKSKTTIDNNGNNSSIINNDKNVTCVIPLYPKIVAFSHILRSECEESFLDVLSAVRTASIELLLARVKAANPLKGDKWAEEEVAIKTGDINTNMKNSQMSSLNQPKKPGSHSSFVGYLTEAEWTDIVKYMYSRDDAIEIIGRCRMAAETEIKESGIGAILGLNSANPDKSLAETSLIGISRRDVAELRRTLKEHPTAYLKFDTFICIMQGFQLEGHLKFLGSFVDKFKEIDSDRDGILNELDFRRLCSAVSPEATPEQLDELADAADPFGSNAVTLSRAVDVLHDALVRAAQRRQ